MSRLFGWDLPPGVTDSMCEPYDPRCGNCGHLWSAHYSEDRDLDHKQYKFHNIERDLEYMAIEYNAEGERVHGCDAVINTRTREQCDCLKFGDFEYEDFEYED